jgi:hypothetical protein
MLLPLTLAGTLCFIYIFEDFPTKVGSLFHLPFPRFWSGNRRTKNIFEGFELRLGAGLRDAICELLRPGK